MNDAVTPAERVDAYQVRAWLRRLKAWKDERALRKMIRTFREELTRQEMAIVAARDNASKCRAHLIELIDLQKKLGFTTNYDDTDITATVSLYLYGGAALSITLLIAFLVWE